jgi:hypothetical protein
MLFAVGIDEMHLCYDIFNYISERPWQDLLDSRRDQNRCLSSATILLSGFGGGPSGIPHSCELSDANHHWQCLSAERRLIVVFLLVNYTIVGFNRGRNQ